MLALQVIVLLAVSGLYGHLCARCWDALREMRPRRQPAALTATRRAIRTRRALRDAQIGAERAAMGRELWARYGIDI